MSIKSKPFYWLECDACGISSSDEGGDVRGATAEAEDAYWKITDDGRHYCEDDANRVCRECDVYDPEGLAEERDYLCRQCWALDYPIWSKSNAEQRAEQFKIVDYGNADVVVADRRDQDDETADRGASLWEHDYWRHS